ncbi:hypothetical protein BCR37DRAFT_390125 [Protomyces lactucae-debilis]|uniref:Uncharacterized protein n=1 Tax=Protomyces lactucae-debilis TaxID=2754530 RepID=A0A1Y2FU97_PROLT|nr:uncharacterized protein BCR37DRAFT_390125 [Protomyces lactucae-debilis]ORY87580.1 hypothetical protein BCR37DRAFT_390125 [Protomyces lactucae-debilis]
MLAGLLLFAGCLSSIDAIPHLKRNAARLEPRQFASSCVPSTVTVLTTIPQCTGNACAVQTITSQGQSFSVSTLGSASGIAGQVFGGTTFDNPASTVQNAGVDAFTICDDDCTVAGVPFPSGSTVFFTNFVPVPPGTNVAGGTTVTDPNVPVTTPGLATSTFVSTIINGQTITDANQLVTTTRMGNDGTITTVVQTITQILSPNGPQTFTVIVPGTGTTVTRTITVTNGGPGDFPSSTSAPVTTVPGVTTSPGGTSSLPPVTSGSSSVPGPPIPTTGPGSSSSSVVSTSGTVDGPPGTTTPGTSSTTSATTPPEGPPTTTSVTTSISVTSSTTSASATSSVNPRACSTGDECTNNGFPLGICLDASNVPIVGGLGVDTGFCALSAILPPFAAGSSAADCLTSDDCTNIGLSLCLFTALPVTGGLPLEVGRCVLGASTEPNPAADSGGIVTGLLSLNQPCTATSQCGVGLCLPVLLSPNNGLCLLQDPVGDILTPLGQSSSTGGGTPTAGLSGVVNTILGPITPTTEPLTPVVDGILDGVGTVVDSLGGGNAPGSGAGNGGATSPSTTTGAGGGIPANPLPSLIANVGEAIGGLGGTSTAPGPLAAVTDLTNAAAGLVGGLLGGGQQAPSAPAAPASPTTLFTQTAPAPPTLALSETPSVTVPTLAAPTFAAPSIAVPSIPVPSVALPSAPAVPGGSGLLGGLAGTVDGVVGGLLG